MVRFLDKEIFKNFNKYSTILSSQVGRLLVTAASAGSVISAALAFSMGNVGAEFISTSLLSILSAYVLFNRTGKNMQDVVANERYISTKKHDKIMKDLIREVKHELRTPISCIVSAEEILQNLDLTPQQSMIVKNMARSANFLENVIENINAYRQMKDDTIGKLNKCNINQLMNDIQFSFMAKAKAKNIELIMRVDKSIPSKINIYDVHVKRILINLLSNAIKYTDEGEIYFTAQIIQKSNEYGFISYQLQFTVKDSGIGIPPQMLDKVFKKNVRVDNNDNKGSGLGLALCETLVDELDGYMTVESTLSKGSTFSCFIPIEETPLNNDEIRLKEKKNKTILIVEDNKSNQLILKHLIRDDYNFIHIASNGKEALEISKENKVDVVLMDINLTNETGYDVSKKIIKQCQKLKQKPPAFIGLSGEDINQQNEMAIKYGFAASLQKPYKKAQLLAEINKAALHKNKLLAA